MRPELGDTVEFKRGKITLKGIITAVSKIGVHYLIEIKGKRRRHRVGLSAIVQIIKKKDKFEEQKIKVLELLKHGVRLPISKITSYAPIGERATPEVIAKLEKDGLIVLYPNRFMRSKGDYGITSKGRTFIIQTNITKKV